MNLEPGLNTAVLPPRWETARLAIEDACQEDVPLLAAVFNANAHVAGWDETFHPVPQAEIAELVRRSLDTSPEYGWFRLQVIRIKPEFKAGGYFHLHHGRPEHECAWISMFVLHPDVQRGGLGREAASGLAQQLAGLGYRSLRLRVYLKNWPALRFWIGLGFTTILKVEGEAVYTPQGHASLVLEKYFD